MAKEQLQQLDFSSPDDLTYLFPYLEPSIELQELTLKQKYDGRILLSSIASFFCIRLTIAMQDFFDHQEVNRLINKTITTSFYIFFSLLTGFFIDIFSIQATWKYFSLVNILYLIILLIGYQTYAQHLILLGSFLYQSLLPVCLINFTCILYEASADLSTRLNNGMKLQIFGYVTPVLVVVIFDMILNAVEPNLMNNSNNSKSNKIAISISLTISLVMNFSSLFVLSKTHSLIEKFKSASRKYRQFRISQGMMISISGIYSKLFNLDMVYIFAIQAVSSYQIQFIQRKSKYSFINNCQTIIMLSSAIIIGYWIVNYANKHKSLVTISYRIVSICIWIFAVIGILRILIEYLFDAEDNNSKNISVSYILSYILNCIVYTLWLISYSVVHQAIIFLLPPRCAIRGISLSLMFFFYFVFEFLTTLLSERRPYLIVQAILSLAVLIFDRYYNRKKSFEELDQLIPLIYSLQNQRLP